jgi:putative transposase
MAKFEVPEGWCVQAFRFSLDPSEDQARSLARHFGARRTVRAAVKRGADRKTRPSRAGGREARKRTNRKVGEQPRDGVRVA